MPSFAVILPAAGQSNRFGGAEKKPFLQLNGTPIWQRSAELFCHRSDVAKVCVVVSPDDRKQFESRFGAICKSLAVEIVSGGAERFESVANALATIPDSVDFVAVHDAVRPLLTQQGIDDVFAAAVQHGAAMLGTPVVDTLKRVESALNRIMETVPRAGLWAAQTPQVFRRDWLVEAYAWRHIFDGSITDDAQLIEAQGHAVVMVPSTPTNFKITTPWDFELAELILKARITL
jgi:2-C-methyl-D-erythritol 4-phosphate cytidylyltransferase